ncbi:MAG: hypothetical protein ACFFDP_10710, partial [Promethearchaeota archaeon]
DGFYNATIPTAGLETVRWTVTIAASYPNTIQKAETFTAQLTPITTRIILADPVLNKYYNDSFRIFVFFSDTWTNEPNDTGVDGVTMNYVWGAGSGLLLPNGTLGWYYADLIATGVVTTSLPIEISISGIKDGFQYASASITITVFPQITILEFYKVEAVRNISGVEYSHDITIADAIWHIPVSDYLRIYVNLTNLEGIPRTDAMGFGTLSIEILGASEFFEYNKISRLWVAMIYLRSLKTGSVDVSFVLPFHDTSLLIHQLQITTIPLNIEVVNEDEFRSPIEVNTILSYRVYSIELNLTDTWHGIGVTNAAENLTIDMTGILGLVKQSIEEVGNGIYIITIYSTTPSSGILRIGFEEEFLENTFFELEGGEISMALSSVFSPQDTLIINSTIIIAVIVFILIISWTLWARILSIPWEVRRLRKFAKSVEKHQGYTLGRKDQKRFRTRDLSMEEPISNAMATIGVLATPAMIPTSEELEEVTATEEDILGELDKIPGLGAEEKAVLAEEMRKIPRVDRVWFLNDLRRQMAQRRMDFLTTRERPPKPTEEKVTPLDEVEPAEPPEPTEDVAPPDEVEPVEAPRVLTAVEREINRELAKIPGLTADEKEALVEHLKTLNKAQRKDTYRSLKQSQED